MLTWALKYRLYNHGRKFLECWIHLQYGLIYRPLCGDINKSITLRTHENQDQNYRTHGTRCSQRKSASEYILHCRF